MTQKLLLMAAGGTGGHMFPAQALAEAMLRKGWRVKLSTDARGARYTGGFPHMTEITEVSSATFARGGLLAKAMVAPRIAAGVASMALEMRRERPDVVIGFGGYPSIPALGAATLLGLPGEALARTVDGYNAACGAGDFEPLTLAQIAAAKATTGGPIGGRASVNADCSGPGVATVMCDVEVDPETGAMDPDSGHAHACTIADVEVDDETGVVTVLGIWSAYEIGRAINIAMVKQQIDGGCWMGISHALFETTEPTRPY